MNVQFPKTLQLRGRQINFAGNGQAAGARLYVDVASQKTYEVFAGRVRTTGPAYCKVQVEGNDAMEFVRVDHQVLNGRGPARVGDLLLVGALHFTHAGPNAQAAWAVRVDNGGGPPQPQQSSRRSGMIVELAEGGAFGWILAEGDGHRVFVHRSQLRAGAVLAVGSRVSFVEAHNGRGLTAYDVRPAR